MVNSLLASTSTIYGGTYLDYLFDSLKNLYQEVEEIVFIPYARPSGITYTEYTSLAEIAFQKIGKHIRGIHTFENPVQAIRNAEGIFTGGGNSFVLVSELYNQNLIPALQEVINSGTPYLGTSAGSNIAGPSIRTSNDMPIVYPPSFATLGIVPFNINPHYLDPIPNSKHKGETRETRIKEFHQFNDIPVIGLREGSWIRIQNQQIVLKGEGLTARGFEKDKTPYEIEVETALDYLK
ncbi:dipeptidase PepE [Maribacter algarum]|uniref:Dipeptidase PepE n=1 Tax=Maribacter algarum (ex Zhang et al. 2020) TaxID=2578118 RepID=A0A5S3PP46_9FLAO|nr:dipeptidase PepE [Maribacter algarum]TMM56269.1 dipeptidase PepE [Maribacter algarum]